MSSQMRSIYRVIEMAQGYNGVLMSAEAYLIALDRVPLILATVVWVVCWPHDLLDRATE